MLPDDKSDAGPGEALKAWRKLAGWLPTPNDGSHVAAGMAAIESALTAHAASAKMEKGSVEARGRAEEVSWRVKCQLADVTREAIDRATNDEREACVAFVRDAEGNGVAHDLECARRGNYALPVAPVAEVEKVRCNIPARSLPPCDLDWGHEGDLHGSAGDGFYARDHDDEHHRRQAARDDGESNAREVTAKEARAAVRQIDGYESQLETLEAFIDSVVSREASVREEGRVEERKAIQALALDHYDINAFLRAIAKRNQP